MTLAGGLGFRSIKIRAARHAPNIFAAVAKRDRRDFSASR
jgi:hypothetical protein